jgi:S-DNA-T family DNA segregation ATPase FtsK/SpoIIIE
VDVITGVIKANFPTRISFQVTSRIDSRTILGEQGAEQLLGMGDMLYMSGGSRITRVHGTLVTDREVEAIVNHLKLQGEPEYVEDVTAHEEAFEGGEEDGESDSEGDLYSQAVQVVVRDKKASTSYVQRRLKIGYNRAASLIERMEEEGVVSAPNHVGKREVLLESV